MSRRRALFAGYARAGDREETRIGEAGMREFDGAIKNRDGDGRVATRTKKLKERIQVEIHTYYEYVSHTTRVIGHMSTVGCVLPAAKVRERGICLARPARQMD